MKIWMPLYAEFLIPFSFVLLAANNDHGFVIRILAAAFVIVGLLFRLIVRKRRHIPAWPPV
jgi:hypothetical protein